MLAQAVQQSADGVDSRASTFESNGFMTPLISALRIEEPFLLPLCLEPMSS